MVLTNMLPSQGNGRTSSSCGRRTARGILACWARGTKTCANASAVKPFGAIDTPTQGGVAAGAAYVNFGWVLTPRPKTIPDRRVDDQRPRRWRVGRARPTTTISGRTSPISSPATTTRRATIGFRILNTTSLTNGQHTIVVGGDDAGRGGGDRQPFLHRLEWRRGADGGGVTARRADRFARNVGPLADDDRCRGGAIEAAPILAGEVGTCARRCARSSPTQRPGCRAQRGSESRRAASGPGYNVGYLQTSDGGRPCRSGRRSRTRACSPGRRAWDLSGPMTSCSNVPTGGRHDARCASSWRRRGAGAWAPRS